MVSRKKEKSKTVKAKGEIEANKAQSIIGKAPVPQEATGNISAGFPVVGIGASAGGLAAFEAFFSGMPAETDPGMAFVLVQHLDPNHKSILTELIRRYTRMQVFEVEDGMRVHPNCAYIIPPNCDMAFLNGSLQLLQPTAPRGRRLPIDFFFRSLAQDQHERAICIVLSGTGSDGTLGVRDIKSEGGMVMVQDPVTTEYDGMPRSAISTGLVDYALPPVEMAAQLMAYTRHAFSKPSQPGTVLEPAAESALKKIFILLRSQTGNDFSQYKPSTIRRRIERRMAVHQIATMDNYVKLLQRTPAEVEALFRDMLIGVTNFFRDTEAFKSLEEQVIPKLFTGKPVGGTIRVWVPGCSTGEEAYSIAILLAERQQALKQSFQIQIFATDIDGQAIAAARTALYPANIASDISPERLAQFFTVDRDGSSYRVHKGIRDLLVFSEQNVIKDPPFSKLDLVSCRNLMIYLGGELQRKLIPLFHYALNPRGYLFLGTSDSTGGEDDLFGVVDRKMKLYQRKEDYQSAHRVALSRFLPAAMAVEIALPRNIGKTTLSVKVPLREVTEHALLQQVFSAGALVTSQGDILYLHGRTGLYLEPAPGEAEINNILKMAREGLRRELTTALRTAVGIKEVVRHPGLRVKTNGHYTTVNLTIRPVTAGANATPEAPLYLVILEEVEPGDSGKLAVKSESSVVSPEPSAENRKSHGSDSETSIEKLKMELRAKDEYLQTAHEELETSNEELKSSNEEMQSVNEELQSTNEELETSKEELQSVNEELATINVELQNKVQDLSRSNNDMNNLLSGTGIATIFVDHQLRILRFTPNATRIINLILNDVGRPVGHIVSNLIGYSALISDLKTVLETLIPKEAEVQTTTGQWYTLHMMPYRTIDNVIEGAVITFVEISEIVRMREALRKTNELLRLAVVVRDAHDAITVQDLEGRTLAWNPGAVRMYGWSEDEALAMNIKDRIPEALRTEALSKVQQLSQAVVLEPYATQRITKNGSVMEISMISTALVDEAGKMYAISTTERAIPKKEE